MRKASTTSAGLIRACELITVYGFGAEWLSPAGDLWPKAGTPGRERFQRRKGPKASRTHSCYGKGLPGSWALPTASKVAWLPSSF